MLFGNLAPNGAIVKRSAVKQEMLVNTGTARCFDSEEEAIAAIYAGKIVPGDVVVIRYEARPADLECGKCFPPPPPSWE